MVEGAALEKRYAGLLASWVRIPLSPPILISEGIIVADILILVALGIFLVLLLARLRDVIIVTDSPYVPLHSAALAAVINVLDLSPGQKFYELGCGDGRVLLAVHQAYPESQLIGIEKGWWPWMIAQVRWLLIGAPKNVKIYHADIRTINFHPASTVFAYLMPGFLEELMPQFHSQLKSGCTVITAQFPLPGEKSSQAITVQGGSSIARRLYVYKF